MPQKKNKSFYTLFLSIRLSLIICALTCVILLTLSYFIERAFENYSIQQNVDELNAVMKSIQAEIVVTAPINEKNNNEIEQNIALILAGHHGLFTYIQNDHGKVIYRTRGPNLLILRQHQDFNHLIQTGNTAIWNYQSNSYRIAISKLAISDEESYTIIAAVGRNLQLQYIQRLHDGLFILIIITCIFTFIITISTIYLTQRPIDRLSKKIQSITSKHLNYRIPLSVVPAKFVGIIESFNDMLSRIEEVFQRQRNFTADIAHEMRTPITNLATQTQIVLNSARTTDEYREILYSNLEEYEYLSKMITDMLFLAQADNKQLTPERVTINLSEAFFIIFDYFEPLTEDKNITLTLVGEAKPIIGDRLMLSRAIGNLLSNAIRYTPEGETITITLKQLDKDHLQFIIANPGKQIDKMHLSRLFDRFYRIDQSRQRNGEGSGIGLAIVKSIIESHHGKIHAESDEISTRFVVTLPNNTD